MFMYWFVFLFVFLTIFNSMTLNLIVWWSVFVLMTLTFIFLQKKQGSLEMGLNYFLLQEFLGLLFLVFVSYNLQFLILMMKVGVSPFHFWIFNMFMFSDGLLLLWFLTFQKLPFLPVLLTMFKFYLFLLLMLGIVMCYYQIFLVKNYKMMLAVSSTESFNWLMLGIFMGSLGFLMFCLYYFINMMLIINFQTFGYSMNFFLEMTLVFLNIPLSFSFFLKIFMLSVSVSLNSTFLLLILFSMVLTSLSFMGWLVYFSTTGNKVLSDHTSYYFFLLYLLFFVIYF